MTESASQCFHIELADCIMATRLISNCTKYRNQLFWEREEKETEREEILGASVMRCGS